MRLRAKYPDFVHAVGGDLRARLEDHPNPAYVDHVWITMDIGAPQRVLVSINTQSKRNRDAGFDDRIRVGIVRGTAAHRPPRGMAACRCFDYAEVEHDTNVFYEHHTRADLENLLLRAAARAVLLEVWGAPYHSKRHPGIHQIHSRRASCAVTEDVRGQDGALRFYYAEEQQTELMLFKFCGQP